MIITGVFMPTLRAGICLHILISTYPAYGQRKP